MLQISREKIKCLSPESGRVNFILWIKTYRNRQISSRANLGSSTRARRSPPIPRGTNLEYFSYSVAMWIFWCTMQKSSVSDRAVGALSKVPWGRRICVCPVPYDDDDEYDVSILFQANFESCCTPPCEGNQRLFRHDKTLNFNPIRTDLMGDGF